MKSLRKVVLEAITCPHERKWRTAGDLTDRIISAIMEEAKLKCKGIENCPLLKAKELR